MISDCLKLKFNIMLAIAILFLMACANTAPTHFYIMHPISDPEHKFQVAKDKKISIALSPVSMPEHLNRSQIVTRQSGNQVNVDEFNRWAEPLDASFTTILTENLSRLLYTDEVFILNRPQKTHYDYHLLVDVIRFDGQMGVDATLVCRWQLYSGDKQIRLNAARSTITQPLNGTSYQDLVSSLSSILADFSREIATRIITESVK